jgi:hypothetical protein
VVHWGWIVVALSAGTVLGLVVTCMLVKCGLDDAYRQGYMERDQELKPGGRG